MAFLDSSVLLASLNLEEAHHRVSDCLESAGGHHMYAHALAESFSVLTGGRKGRRFSAQSVVALMEVGLLPYVAPQTLTGKDFIDAMRAAHHRGVGGGAIYDWLHLAAARKARAEMFFILSLRDFQALARPGDPAVQSPTNP